MMTKRFDEARQLRLAHHRERDIGQRPGRDEDQPARMGVRRGDDGVDGVRAARRLGRLGQHGMAEAALAMDVSRVRRSGRQRRRGPRPDGNIAPSRERQHRPRVAGRGVEAHVADDRRDAEDLGLGRGAGVEKRERVVDSGVDVDDKGFSRLRHGRHS